MVLRLPDSWSNWNLEMLVFEEKGKPEYPEKTSRSKGENQQQTQPTYGVDVGIRTQATLVGGECSHHCATLAPRATISGWRACVAQKCLCLSSLFIDYYKVAQETGANNRPQKLFHDAITHKTAKWPKHTYYYTFPICNWIHRTCDVG